MIIFTRIYAILLLIPLIILGSFGYILSKNIMFVFIAILGVAGLSALLFASFYHSQFITDNIRVSKYEKIIKLGFISGLLSFICYSFTAEIGGIFIGVFVIIPALILAFSYISAWRKPNA